MARVAELVSSKLALLTDSYNANAKTLITPVYNVAGYGAKGDGITDDTAAIQASIDAAIAAGAKIVYFPHGTYKVTSLANLSSVVLAGDSAAFSGITDIIAQLGGLDTRSLVTPVYNVKGYGAKGDSITDDTAAIQAAIDACPNYGIVAFPPGTYLVKNTFTLNRPISLIGYGGKHGCTIYADFATTDQAIFEFIGTEAASIRYCRIEHLTLRSKTAGIARGLTLQYANRFVVNDVQLYELYRGIYTYYAWDNAFRDVISYQITTESVKVDAQSNHLTFDHCRLTGDYGIRVVGGLAGLDFRGCSFEQIVTKGISLEPPTGTKVEGVAIIGGYWEQIEGNAISTGGAGDTKGLVIDGNYFYGGYVNKFASTAGKATYGIILSHVDGFAISQNRFYDWATSAIYRDTTELNGTVANNSLELCPALTNSSNLANQTIAIRNNTYGRKEIYTTAAPTAGTWSLGDVAYNTSPAAAGKIGWVCVTAGTPGTWKAFGAIDA